MKFASFVAALALVGLAACNENVSPQSGVSTPAAAPAPAAPGPAAAAPDAKDAASVPASTEAKEESKPMAAETEKKEEGEKKSD